jgi:hypothetical protein
MRSDAGGVSRAGRIFGAGLAVISTVAIGCGGGGTPTAPATTMAASPTVVAQDDYPRVPANTGWGAYFSIDRPGTIEATFDYTLDTNRIAVWIARGRCDSVDFAANQCTFVATSLTGSRPRKVVVTGAASGEYTFHLINFGPGDESVSFQIVLIP